MIISKLIYNRSELRFMSLLKAKENYLVPLISILSLTRSSSRDFRYLREIKVEESNLATVLLILILPKFNWKNLRFFVEISLKKLIHLLHPKYYCNKV